MFCFIDTRLNFSLTGRENECVASVLLTRNYVMCTFNINTPSYIILIYNRV